MFNLGFSEFIAIAVIALLVIGPKQLPEVAKVIGRLMGELRKATQDLSGGLLEVKRDVESSIHEVRDNLVNEGHKIKDSILDPEEPHDDRLHKDQDGNSSEITPTDQDKETPDEN